MKIFYVDMQYDYGIQARGPNSIGQDGFKRSLELLGHEVVPFYYDEYLQNTDKLQSDLIAFADAISPELILFSLYTHQFEIATLEYLKSKYTTINWFGDDQWRFDNFTYIYANHFTYCITTDKYAIPKYKKIGQHNVIYSQWAAINTHKIPNFEGYKYDVTFVGGFHPYRKWFVDKLKKRGIRIEAFGNGWENGPLSAEQMNWLFVSSKINLNIGNSDNYDMRYVMSHWRIVFLLRKKIKNANQIKARNFEIPYFGGFQLSDYVPTIENYFDIGKEIVCYKDVDEAELLIRYYLDNDEERESIKNAGQVKSVTSHGYKNRLQKILEQII